MVDFGSAGLRDVGELLAPMGRGEHAKQEFEAGVLLAVTAAGTAVLATRMATLWQKLELLSTAGLMMANGGVMVVRGLGKLR